MVTISQPAILLSRMRRFSFMIFLATVSFLVFSQILHSNHSIRIFKIIFDQSYRRRPECVCSRPPLFLGSNLFSLDISQNNRSSRFCSVYATRRGPHQRVIAISMFGPRENRMFQLNRSKTLLTELIEDFNTVYADGFVLRVYHDNTISTSDFVCPFECRHSNVDFCDVTEKSFIPPKIWRFIPAGDPLVDIMMSRDLDSALTERERAAVNVWLASNKLFHTMRDHPLHHVPMLGGMWGFRPSLDRNLSRHIHHLIHDRDLIRRYGGRTDQAFLTHHVWPLAKRSAIAHDSFLCGLRFGHQSQPFPTQRPPANQTNCFVGCVRPCCGTGTMPFGSCPTQCRPKDHRDWVYC